MAHDSLSPILEWTNEDLKKNMLKAGILKELPKWPLHPRMVKRHLRTFNRVLRQEAVAWATMEEEGLIGHWKAWATLIVDSFDWTGQDELRKRVSDLLSRRLQRAQLRRELALAKETSCPA